MSLKDHIVISFCVFWVISEIIINRIKLAKDNTGTKDKDDKSLLIMWGAIVLSVVISAICKDVLKIGNFIKFEIILIAVSLSLIVIGTIIRYKAIFTLKKAYSVNISVSKDQKIIKEWLYKKIRHPGYLGMLICFIGLGLSFRNIYAIIAVLVINVLVLLFRINLEEKVMKEHFGKEYEKYCEETNKLIYKVY